MDSRSYKRAKPGGNRTEIADAVAGASDAKDARVLYFSLLNLGDFSDGAASNELRVAAREFLLDHLKQVSVDREGADDSEIRPPSTDDCPDNVSALRQWIDQGAESAGRQYRQYVEQRKAGMARSYFPTRSHALHFLNAVAPTKLVDGAWLYGLSAHWRDARLRPLLRIYLEELGDGDSALNHVVLYRQLLDREDCFSPELLTSEHYLQGALQLALACNAEEFLPEVIGFNLGYEQLPLHLLITAYELRELGIDPFYFTLHITIDNSHSGHACKALKGLLNMLPRGRAEADEFMRRVRSGAALNSCGIGSTQIIESFDLHETLIKILMRKSKAGKYLHGDFCRVGGRTVTDWLQHSENMPQFLLALENTGWIKRGQVPEQSRFWQLISGDRAKMFGVFTAYEQQVLRDWIAGDALIVDSSRSCQFPVNQHAPGNNAVSDLGGDISRLEERLADTNNSDEAMQVLQPWLAPDRHHTPAGMFATREFSRMLG